MDCYLYEGQKVNDIFFSNMNTKMVQVLFRTALALLKVFHKTVSDKKSALYNEAKKDGVYKSFENFCKNLQICPEELLKLLSKYPDSASQTYRNLQTSWRWKPKLINFTKLEEEPKSMRSWQLMAEPAPSSFPHLSTDQVEPILYIIWC